MSRFGKEFGLLTGILALLLLLTPVLGYGNNDFSSAEQDQVKSILIDRYSKLPDVQFDFSDQPDAEFEEMAFRSYSNLAISKHNLMDGILVGLVTYGDRNYLLMSVELPGEVDANYGAGLIEPSNDEVVFVSEAELSDHGKSIDKVSFDLEPAGENSPNLNLMVMGQKYELKIIVPKLL